MAGIHRFTPLLATTLFLGIILHSAVACAQPEAMPVTVISPDLADGPLGTSLSVGSSASTSASAFPNATQRRGQTAAASDWGDEGLPANSGAGVGDDVVQTGYAGDMATPSISMSPTPTAALQDPAGMMQYGPVGYGDPWSWQVLPDGLIYRDYLASQEESRFASQSVYDKKLGWIWDVTLGGHVALLRYGTQDPQFPEGWEVGMEGAVFPRLDGGRNIMSADFRFAVPITYRVGAWETKFGYYHLSSHLGDIYIEKHPGVLRIPYDREQVVFGVGYRPTPDVRIYGEANYAFHYAGGAKPWEFQFGFEYSPARTTGFYGSPFFAVNGQVREEVDYSGNVTGEAGWQWRGASGHLFRIGVQYFNGMSDQRQFFGQFENYIGGGIWYDY